MSRELNIYDLPTILGISNNPSPWTLWNTLKDRIPPVPQETARGDWNRRMRPTILEGIKDRYAVELSPLPAIKEPESIISVSGALQIDNPGTLPLKEPASLFLLRQISSEALAFQWKTSEGVKAPLTEVARAHLFMMAHQQPRCVIFVLVSAGESEHLIEVDYDQAFAQEMMDKVHDFKTSLVLDLEPDPDFTVDGSSLEKLYKPTDPNPIDLREQTGVIEIIKGYRKAAEDKKAAGQNDRKMGKIYDEAKARMKAIMGSHRTAIVTDTLTVECKEVSVGPSNRNGYSYQTYDVAESRAN